MRRLWAPWRMVYIDQGLKESGCIFCDKFSAGDSREALVLVRTRHSLVMLNKYPYNNGHVLIAPQRHEKHLSGLSAEEYGDLNEALRGSVDIVREVLQSIVAVEQMLRHHPGLADDGHEIGIALPARHDVPVQMVFDAGTGALAEIHSQIDSARLQHLAHDVHRAAQRLV